MSDSTVLLEIENQTAILTLNRPDRLNALNNQLQQELEEALQQLDQNPRIFGIVITGSGKAFCAGGDLKERLTHFTPDGSIYGDAMLSRIRRIFQLIEGTGKPVIAAINGAAYGGGAELALACDIRVISQSAKIGLTEPKVGMIPGAGGTQRLPRLVGTARAKELLFSAEAIDADEAYRIGLVNRVVPDGESVVQAACSMMERFARNAPLAIRMSKFAINKGMDMSLSEGLDFEASCTAFLRTTEDRTEGICAFQEKRKPQFQGR